MTAGTTKARITVASISTETYKLTPIILMGRDPCARLLVTGVQRDFLPIEGFGNMGLLSMRHYVRHE
jgi:hypothetical protein